MRRGSEEYNNNKNFDSRANQRKNSQDSSKTGIKQQLIQDLLNKAKNLTSPNQGQMVPQNPPAAKMNNQYRSTHNRTTLSKVSNENPGLLGSQNTQVNQFDRNG